MMLTKIIFKGILPVLLGFSLAYSQETPGKWGKPSQREQLLSRDSVSAQAVILSDVGSWSPHDLDRGLVAFEREIRIKILEAPDSPFWRVVLRLRSQDGQEKLKKLEAQTLLPKLNGKSYTRIPLSLSRLEPTDALTPWQEYAFQFREVAAGAIIEYRYSVISNQVETLAPWWFQDSLPTLYSEVRLKGFEKNTYLHAPVGKLTRGQKKGLATKWIRRDQDAVKPFANPQLAFPTRAGQYFQFSHLPAIETAQYESGDRWDPIKGWYGVIDADSLRWRILNENLWLEAQPPESAPQEARALASLAQSLIRSASTQQDTLQLLRTHITQHMKWNGEYSRRVYRTPAEIYKSQIGSSADLNTLYMALLELTGIEVAPYFIQPHSMGDYIPIQPLQVQFSHLLVGYKTPQGWKVADATNPQLPLELLPPDMLHGRIYTPFGADSGWHRLPPPSLSTANLSVYEATWEEDSLHFTLEATLSGYDAMKFRAISPHRMQRDVPSLLGLPEGNYQTEWLFHDDPATSLVLIVEGSVAYSLQVEAFHPFRIWRPSLPLLPDKGAERIQFLYPSQTTWQIAFPPCPKFGWENLPAPFLQEHKGPEVAIFAIQPTQKSQDVQVAVNMGMYQLRYGYEQYPELKAYWESIAAVLHEWSLGIVGSAE